MRGAVVVVRSRSHEMRKKHQNTNQNAFSLTRVWLLFLPCLLMSSSPCRLPRVCPFPTLSTLSQREVDHINEHVNGQHVELNRPAHMGLSSTTMALRSQGVSLLASSGASGGMMAPPRRQQRVQGGAPPPPGASSTMSGSISGGGEVKISTHYERDLEAHERGPMQNQTAMAGVNTVSYKPEYSFILKQLGVLSN